MTPSKPLSEDPSPFIGQARFGGKVGQTAGDFTTKAAMIAIARRRFDDVLRFCTVPRPRFSHQDSDFAEDLAAFSQQPQGVRSLDAEGAAAPAPLQLKAAQIAKEESHGEIWVADLFDQGATDGPLVVTLEMMRRIRIGHGSTDY